MVRIVKEQALTQLNEKRISVGTRGVGGSRRFGIDREQARSYMNSAVPCRSELARDEVMCGTAKPAVSLLQFVHVDLLCLHLVTRVGDFAGGCLDLYQPYWIEGPMQVKASTSEIADAGYQMEAEKIYVYELQE